MKKFWSYFIISVLVIVAVFFLVSLILSNIHEISMVAEWQRWLDLCGIIKDTSEPVIETVSDIGLLA